MEDDTLQPQPEQKAPAAAGKSKKKPTLLKKVLIGVALLAGALLIVVLILGGTLLSRISKPGTTVFADEEATFTPAATAAATPAPAAVSETPGVTPIPTPTPVSTPLPLSELYTQTELTTAQQAAITAQNANKQDYINVLLVGVDRRGTKGDSNADVVMIATIDKKNGRLKLTSMLRDLYVPIPGHNSARLNSAAAKGGIPLLIETINQTLHMEIANYVLVDFSMFEKIVNKLGGVTVRMSTAEISAANDNIAGLNKQRGVEYLWDGFIFAEAGNVRLDGKQALGYARIRKIDSDFVRTSRQFNVLNAIFAKFRSKNLAEQYALLYDLMPYVESDLSSAQIIEYAYQALSINTSGLMHETIPYKGYYKSGRVKGSSVLLFDMPATAWKLHDFIYTSVGEPTEAKLLSGGKSLPPRTPGPTLPPTLTPEGLPGATVLPGEDTPDPSETFAIPELDETPVG